MIFPPRHNPRLQEFTVQDWRKICVELHIRTAGRKDELQRRVITLLSTEDGRKRVHSPHASDTLRHLGQVLGLPVPKAALDSDSKVTGVKIECLCGGTMTHSEVTMCARCQTWQHKNCIGKAALMAEYQCPRCQLSQIEPLDRILQTLVEAAASFAGGQGNLISFKFEPMSFEDAENVDRSVQIRCIRLEEGGYLQRWPKDGMVVFNGKVIEDFSQAPGEPLGNKRRKDYPLVVKNLNIGGQNTIAVLKRRDTDIYAFAVYQVETVSSDILISQFSTEHVLSLDDGRDFAKDHSRLDEAEVYAENYCQVLRCPLTRLLPELPARGYACTHVQCFDLSAFVILQESAQSHRWRCPICRGPAFRVVVDTFIQRIVNEAKRCGNCSSVEFESSGGYRLLLEENDDTPVKRGKYAVRTLLWSDFSKGYADEIDLRSTSPYVSAVSRDFARYKELLGVTI